jgi:hypothetical protein
LNTNKKKNNKDTKQNKIRKIIVAKDLRNEYAQRRYRQNSRSENKNEQDVAHKVPLGLVAYIHNKQKYIG